MLALIAILWAVYLSECFVRWRPGETIVRSAGTSAGRSVNEADVSLFGERVGFVWTTPLPWRIACAVRGDDVDAACARLRSIHRHTRWVRAASTALFVLLMIAFPVLVFTGRVLPWLAMFGLLVLTAWTATFSSYWVAYRRTHAAGPPIESWLVLALSPIALMRAPLVVALDVSPRTHPLVASDVLCGDREFLRVARVWLFDSPGLRPEIARMLADRGLLAALDAPPDDCEPGATHYCPRCHATFLPSAPGCPDCRGVILSPIRAL